MTIFLPVPELFPDTRARFIQIMNTAAALAAAGVEVKLLAGVSKGLAPADLPGLYGVGGASRLEVVRLPMLRKEKGRAGISWHGVYNISLAACLLRNRTRDGVVLVRHLKLAESLLRLRRLLRMPVIYDAHELFHRSVAEGARRQRLRAREARVAKGADSLLALTSHLARELAAEFDIAGRPITVVPDGVRSEWLRPPGEAGSCKDGYICYAGSLYAWKGVDVAIKAMRLAGGERLVIVGGGSRLEELKALAVSEGVAERVSFTGELPHDEVRLRLWGAKAALLPNIDQGPSEFSSPLKLFEYMASGLPIVASDLPGFREVLRHGENALLVQPGSPEALANGIMDLVRGPAAAGRLAARARLEAEGYTYARRAERIIEAAGAALAGG